MLSEAETDDLHSRLRSLSNVVGVQPAGPKNRPVAWVTTKEPPENLSEADLVANNLDGTAVNECGVMEVGPIETQERILVEPEASTVVDPVKAGAEESPQPKNWVGTGGVICEVTDPSKGTWDDDVNEGDLVRLSNWHVYVGDRFGSATKRLITQPYDGRPVGEVVGCIPIDDGVRCDIAARSIGTDDGWGTVDLDSPANPDIDTYGRSVAGAPTSEAVGRRAIKHGRTTDTTEGELIATGAVVDVQYQDELHTIRGVTGYTPMSEQGDSGSIIYDRETGAIRDVLFAGSNRITIGFPMAHAIEDFGVSPITDFELGTVPLDYSGAEDEGQGPGEPAQPNEPAPGPENPPEPTPERLFNERLGQYFAARYGAENVESEAYLKRTHDGEDVVIGYADHLVDTGDVLYAVESANTSDTLKTELGQARSYAAAHPRAVPVVALPTSHDGYPDSNYYSDHTEIVFLAFEITDSDGPADIAQWTSEGDTPSPLDNTDPMTVGNAVGLTPLWTDDR